MTIVPFMLEWMVQWNGYEPATLNMRLCGASPVMFADIVHEPSSRPTLCGTESPFVHVITSPTAALTGPHALPLTDASTSAAVPAGGSVQIPAAVLAPPEVVAGGFVVVPPPEQAASRIETATADAPRRMARMRFLHLVRGAPR